MKDDGASESANLELKDSNLNILGVIIGSKTKTIADKCAAVAKPDAANEGLFLKDPNPFLPKETSCETIVDNLVKGTKKTNGDVDVAANKLAVPQCEFKKAENLCKHLFPVLPKDKITLSNGSVVDMSGTVSGDGKFTIAEKQFWGADPTKASTSGTGKDEENVVGLGVDTFAWTFAPGDQVGVVVEGESTNMSEEKFIHSNCEQNTSKFIYQKFIEVIFHYR
jgi:hypothetical protein